MPQVQILTFKMDISVKFTINYAANQMLQE